jgi:hypothetical protein
MEGGAGTSSASRLQQVGLCEWVGASWLSVQHQQQAIIKGRAHCEHRVSSR